MVIDIHTHRTQLTPGTRMITSLHFGDHVPAADMYSAGLHPWYLKEDKLDEAINWLNQSLKDQTCMAMGEAGLDKICDTNFNLQIRAFEAAVEAAYEAGKPIIVHCVRAYEEVLALKKRFSTRSKQVPWIFHGFNKKPALASQLLQHGAFLSFGTALLREDSPAAASLAICPSDRFFLETDADDTHTIFDIYSAAAKIKTARPDEIEWEIWNNFSNLFHSK